MRNLVVVGWVALALLCGALPANAQPTSLDALWERYTELSLEFENLLAQSDESPAHTTLGDRVRREATQVADDLAGVIAQLVAEDTSLHDDEREAATDQRLTALQIRGALYYEVGECEEATIALQRVLDDADTETRPLLRTRTEDRLADAERCIEEQRAAATPAPDPVPEPSVAPESVPRDGLSRRQIVGISVGGAGAAMLLTAIAWDASLGSERDEFDTLRARCPGTECTSDDVNRIEELGDTLDSADVPHAILYGVGGAMAITGTVLAVLPQKSRDTVTLAPIMGSGTLGAQCTLRF